MVLEKVMEKKVEVTILKQPFTFVGEDEERIKRDAHFVDDRIAYVTNRYGIVNTLQDSGRKQEGASIPI